MTIRLGAVPEELDDSTPAALWLFFARDGTCLLKAGRLARYLIRGGAEILIDPTPGTDDGALAVFLLGTAFGVLAYQRGFLPLHASAVRIDDGAVVLAGPSGAGKSTLAAALAARGHRFLADDVAVVDAGGDQAVLLPSFPHARLWQDALTRLDLGAAAIANRPGQLKFRVPVENHSDFDPTPVPIRTVIAAAPANGRKQGTVERVEGSSAAMLVLSQIYRPRAAHALLRHAALLQAAARAAATVRVFRLHRAATELDGLAENVALIERAAAQ